MTAIDIVGLAITANGAPISERAQAALLSVRVQRGVCIVGRATLRFHDEGYALSASHTFPIGTGIKISVPGHADLMSGRVTGTSLEQSADALAELVVVVDDLAYKLGRGTKPQTFLDMNYGDVLRKLAGEAGVSITVKAGAELGQRFPYLLQTGSTLSFLDQIARRTGTVWWMEGNDLLIEGAGVSGGEVKLVLGDELFEFSVRASGLRPTGVTITGWDRQNQQQITGKAHPATSSAPRFLEDYKVDNLKSAGGLGNALNSNAELTPTTQSEADALARAIYDADEAGSVVARGTCFINPAIKPAVTVKIECAGPTSGNYLVSEVEHLYTERGLTTSFVAGPRRPTGLVDTLGKPEPDPGLLIGALIIGKVSNSTDPDKAGRVRVKYAALGGEVESGWARVVTIGAGGNRGMVFQPEINDEVLVGFEYGDSRRPLVIGGLFSKANKLPEAAKVSNAQGKVDYRRITSRLGHVIEFADGDTSAAQHILLKLGTAEHKLQIGKDAILLEAATGIPVTIKAGNAQFQITDAGDVSIEGNNVTIKAKQQLAIEGLTTSLKANGKGDIQAATLNVKGSAATTIDGGATLAIKGGVVQVN